MKKSIFNNFFTSGWIIESGNFDLKSRYQMLNVGFILSTLGLIYGIVINIIENISGLIPLELLVLFLNIILFFVLRKYKKSFYIVSLILTVQFTFLFIFLIYVSEPSALKHIWLFTYPIILLYYQRIDNALYWILFMIAMLMIAPYQSFIEVQYSAHQITYLSFVLLVVSVIIYIYQLKINEARVLILEQQNMLKEVNLELAQQVKELKEKDQLLTAQSRQAVMGEMISMIAHQWRQPLSTITLQITNYQFKQLLSKNIKERAIDKTLNEISDTIMYLSETIDDFQTYFHPDKQALEIEVHELVQRAVNFTLPKLKETNIEIALEENNYFIIKTYINEIIQVILNILNNAIDALNEANVKIPKIIITFKSINDSIVVDIKDNANGINDTNLLRLFEPYFSTKGKNGTGLGLYMSQMIMQKQFGTKIEVETSKDGSSFRIEIPKTIS